MKGQGHKGKRVKGPMTGKSLQSLSEVKPRVLYSSEAVCKCRRGEEISSVSTLTEVNAGAGQPFVTQKEINYCQAVCLCKLEQ